MLQLLPHLLTLTVNRWKRATLEFILTCVGLAWHDKLFKVKHFIGSLGGNDLLKRTYIQTLNNLTNIF